MWFSICETRLGDVARCIGAMRKEGKKYPIYQVGMKLYKKLTKIREENPVGVFDELNKRKARHVINMKTATIHTEKCPVVKRIENEDKIGAYLHNPDTAGLKLCGTCIR